MRRLKTVNPHGCAMHPPVDTVDLFDEYFEICGNDRTVQQMLSRGGNAHLMTILPFKLFIQAYEYWEGDVDRMIDDLLEWRPEFALEIEDFFDGLEGKLDFLLTK